MVHSLEGNIILNCHDGWVAKVRFLQEKCQERTKLATALPKKSVNDLHAELGDPSKVITHTTGNPMGIQVIDNFIPCKDCALGKAKECRISKTAIVRSKILEERLYFDISLLSTPTFGGKNHWLLA